MTLTVTPPKNAAMTKELDFLNSICHLESQLEDLVNVLKDDQTATYLQARLRRWSDTTNKLIGRIFGSAEQVKFQNVIDPILEAEIDPKSCDDYINSQIQAVVFHIGTLSKEARKNPRLFIEEIKSKGSSSRKGGFSLANWKEDPVFIIGSVIIATASIAAGVTAKLYESFRIPSLAAENVQLKKQLSKRIVENGRARLSHKHFADLNQSMNDGKGEGGITNSSSGESAAND